MTIENDTFRTSWLAANGLNKDWSYEFRLDQQSHVRIEVRDPVGAISLYDANLALFKTDETEGYVRYPVTGGALATGNHVRVSRLVPYSQEIEIGAEGSFNPELHETAFDNLAMQIQQLKDITDRAAVLPIDSDTTVLELIEDLITAADHIGEIETVSGIAAQIVVVAGIAAEIVTVAGIAAEVVSVANNPHIEPVDLIKDEIQAVAGIVAQVTTVAANIAAIVDVYNNLGTIAAKVNKTGDTMTGRLLVPVVNMAAGGVPADITDGDIWAVPSALQGRFAGATRTFATREGTDTFSGVKTFTAAPILPTSSAGVPAMKIPEGVAKTAPANGDFWHQPEGLMLQKGGTTKRLAFIEEVATGNYVATRAALKALDTTLATSAYLTEAGREGLFLWRAGNFSTQHALDTLEGIYIKATAIASTAGSWVRSNNRVYQAEWFGAVGDGATNDGPAINAALAVGGVGIVLEFQDKVYATSALISVHRDGQHLKGRMGGATFSVAPTTTEGTVFKWTGAAGGTLAYFGCVPAGSADMSGGGIEAIQFNGNLLADKCLHVRSCSFSNFHQIKALNARNTAGAYCIYLDSDVQARTGVNCVYRCNFYNTVITTGGAAAGGIRVTGAVDETSGKHPAFSSFHGLHITHIDGDALRIDSADDMLFADMGVSKTAGGAGVSVHLLPGAGRSVVGLTFIQIHLGSNDTPEFRADASAASSNVHGIAIYGLQGVDHAPTVTEVGGATIEVVDYLGTSYDADAAVRGAYRKTPPLKLGNFASADTSTLDFYRERTNTLLLTFGGAAVGLVTSTVFSRTTRIGNTVNITAQASLTNKGSSVGNAVISGLPYNAISGAALSIYATGLTAGVGDTAIIGLVTTSGSIGLYKMSGGSMVPMTNADFTNATSIVLTGCYHTTDTTP